MCRFCWQKVRYVFADKKGNKENMMISTYEGQDEDASVVIPNASITPGTCRPIRPSHPIIPPNTPFIRPWDKGKKWSNFFKISQLSCPEKRKLGLTILISRRILCTLKIDGILTGPCNPFMGFIMDLTVFRKSRWNVMTNVGGKGRGLIWWNCHLWCHGGI